MSKWIKKEERLSFTGGKVCVFGGQGTGKCITADTMLLTENGYKTLEDIFEEAGHKITPAIKREYNTFIPQSPVKLVNRYGELEDVKELHFNGRKAINRIHTKRGKEISVTKKHPLLVLDDGVFVWKESQNIKVGDYLVSRKGDNVFGKDNTMSLKEAYALGAIIADGYTGEEEISFSNSEPEVLNAIQDYFQEISGTKYKMIEKNNSGSFRIAMGNSALVKKLYHKIGYQPATANGKEIPKAIMQAPKQQVLNFLSGYLGCEGSFEGTAFEVTSASKKLLKQVQLLLENIGIVSTISNKKAANYPENKYYRLSVTGEDLMRLIDIVPFNTSKQLKAIDKIKKRLESREVVWDGEIPNIKNKCVQYYHTSLPSQRDRSTRAIVPKGSEFVSRLKVVELIKNIEGDENLRNSLRELSDIHYHYDEVVSIDELDKDYTYDVTMSRTESFIAEGIVNHNSTFAGTFPRINLVDAEDGQTYYLLDNDNILNVLPTTSAAEVQEALDELNDEEILDSYDTVVIDSGTKLYENMQAAAYEIVENRAKKQKMSGKDIDLDDLNLSMRDWGHIKRWNQQLATTYILMSNLGKWSVVTAHEKELTKEIGKGNNKQIVTIGYRPDLAKKAEHDFDIVLRTYTEKDPTTGEVKFLAEVYKDRTNVTKVGEIIENPTFDIWKDKWESTRKHGVKKIDMSGDIEYSRKQMETEQDELEQIIEDFKIKMKELDKENQVKVTKKLNDLKITNPLKTDNLAGMRELMEFIDLL